REVKVWDLATGREIQAFSLGGEPADEVRVAVSPDGQRLASITGDHTIQVWDLTAPKQMFALKGHTEGTLRLVFSPDSKRLASSSDDNTVRVWDLSDGHEIHHFEG